MKLTKNQIIETIETTCRMNCYQYWAWDEALTDVWIPGNNELVRVVVKDDELVVSNVIKELTFAIDELDYPYDQELALTIYRLSFTDYSHL